MSKSIITSNPITNYQWIWDKSKNPLDFGFRKLTTSENEYTKTYPLWKYYGHTTIYVVFTIDEDNQIDIDVYTENGNAYRLFYHLINEPIVQELLIKLLDILKTLNAHSNKQRRKRS